MIIGVSLNALEDVRILNYSGTNVEFSETHIEVVDWGYYNERTVLWKRPVLDMKNLEWLYFEADENQILDHPTLLQLYNFFAMPPKTKK